MLKQKISIDHLALSPQHIRTVAQWHQAQWQDISPHLTTDLRVELYSSYSGLDQVPCTLLAQLNQQAAGSASLVLSDMETRPELSPWLASVYVHKDFRRQGIATELLRGCISIASSCHIKRLYLFTPDQRLFYEKRGWTLLESCTYHGESVDIMYYELNKHE